MKFFSRKHGVLTLPKPTPEQHAEAERVVAEIAGWHNGVRTFSEDYDRAAALVVAAAEADRQAEFNFGSPYRNDLIIDRHRRTADQKRLEARLILTFWEVNRK